MSKKRKIVKSTDGEGDYPGLGMLGSPPNAHSEDPVELTPDQKEAAMKSLSEGISAAHFLWEQVRDNKLKVSTRLACVPLAARHIERAGALLGSIEDARQYDELRGGQLRAANKEISRLKEQMALGVTVESLGSKLSELADKLADWWRSLGFGYTDGKYVARCGSCSYEVIMHMSIETKPGILFEDSPVTAQQKINIRLDELEANTDFRRRDEDCQAFIINTPKSVAYIDSLIKAKYPGAYIWEYKSWIVPREPGVYQIKSVELHIPMKAMEGV